MLPALASDEPSSTGILQNASRRAVGQQFEKTPRARGRTSRRRPTWSPCPPAHGSGCRASRLPAGALPHPPPARLNTPQIPFHPRHLRLGTRHQQPSSARRLSPAGSPLSKTRCVAKYSSSSWATQVTHATQVADLADLRDLTKFASSGLRRHYIDLPGAIGSPITRSKTATHLPTVWDKSPMVQTRDEFQFEFPRVR